MDSERRVPGDWSSRAVPAGVVLGEQCYVCSADAFAAYRSRRTPGLTLGSNTAVICGSTFDVGPDGVVSVGDYTTLNGAAIFADHKVSIGSYVLIAWDVIILDAWRWPRDPVLRRAVLESGGPTGRAHHARQSDQVEGVTIEDAVWLGFGAIVLPETTIGHGTIVGAKSVVSGCIEPMSVYAGNPARKIRSLD